jgi:glycosyltransferase involved in cell wall biosynthesis
VTTSPRVIIGVPLYNHAHKLPEALDSLLGQVYSDIGVMLVDDASPDDTAGICERYAARDPRVRFHRNDQRLGMIDNWRAAFERAYQQWPQAEYFAWGSDHDLWHPWWLSHLVKELDEHPEAVLAYPLNRRVDADCKLLPRKPWLFDTAGETEIRRRFSRNVRGMSAGNMIYGLFRTAIILRVGVFRHVLVPDRLVLAEAAAYGEFRQVPRILWFRRWYGRIFSLGRQRVSFFPHGRPLYAYVPWWISHAASLAITFGVRGTGVPEISRGRGWWLAWSYFWTAGLLHAWQQLRELRVQLLERASTLRPHDRRLRLLARGIVRRLDSDWMIQQARKAVSSKRREKAASSVKRRVRYGVATVVRTPGTWLLRSMRAVPIVRNRVIPWLIRQDLDTIPTGPVVSEMRTTLRALQKSRSPIIVGPWLSEVGFELLYWIPFLNWAIEEHELDRDRIVAVSRGGPASWYSGIASQYVDIFDHYTIEEYRARNEDRWQEVGNQKQYDAGTFDREILTRVQEQLGLTAARNLHPSVMYRLLRFYWYEKAPVGLLTKHTRYSALPSPGATPAELSLPTDYVAARFYFRPSFPDTPENRRFAADVVRRLSREYPVVLLNPGLHLDDHEDLDVSTGLGVHKIDRWMTPATNLDLQSRIISGAKAFVGTYGGLSYLGPYYRVPTLTFYSTSEELVPAHLDITWRLCRAMQSSLVMLKTADAPLVHSALDGIAPMPSTATGTHA